MRDAQILNIDPNDLASVDEVARDTVIAVDGANVIDNTDQEEIGYQKGIYSVTILIQFLDLVSGGIVAGAGVITMTYSSGTDFWLIPIGTEIKTVLRDRRKYVAKVYESGSAANMRQFKLNEFVVDSGSFEAAWARMPYEIIIGSTSYIRWYESTSDFGTANYIYHAEAYEGGNGTTAATDPSKITHRSAIIKKV